MTDRSIPGFRFHLKWHSGVRVDVGLPKTGWRLGRIAQWSLDEFYPYSRRGATRCLTMNPIDCTVHDCTVHDCTVHDRLEDLAVSGFQTFDASAPSHESGSP